MSVGSLRGVVLVLFAGAFLLQGAERNLILQGRVVMEDGSPLPKPAALEKLCSNRYGNKPGPITRDDGTYTWTITVDPMRNFTCFIHARMEGYISNDVDISAFNGYISTQYHMPDFVLYKEPDTSDPRVMNLSEQGVPRKARDDWKAAVKAIQESGNPADVVGHLNAVVEVAPDFARGWHTLGIIHELLQQPDEAYVDYEKAAEMDDKYAEPRAILSKYYAQKGEWEKTQEVAERLTKVDKDRKFADGFLYLAVADYHLGKMGDAKKAAEKAFDEKESRRIIRGQYVLGRILAAEGNLEEARKQIEQYLAADPNTPDAEQIQASLATLGDESTQPALVIFDKP